VSLYDGHSRTLTIFTPKVEAKGEYLMHLARLQVQNFRSLETIEAEFDTPVTVIIGPNAVGKTTVLEAIRLTKALLAARVASETANTLNLMGIMSPHMPNRMMPRALTNKPDVPTKVKCRFSVNDNELDQLDQIAPQIASTLAQQSIGMTFANASQLISFMSSPAGKTAIASANSALQSEMLKIKSSKLLDLNLTIDFPTGNISGDNPIHGILIGALEQSREPYQTLFSYFPADRALPAGEQPVQLGLADTAQQLESYNSQPQMKYTRLKSAIFTALISKGKEDLEQQFSMIFSRILRGKRLVHVGTNEIGMLSITIEDTESGVTFDIDSLSSGEKGLLLTCLLIGRTVAHGGIVLLDEPELHLNPAVCRDVLEFFLEEFALKKNIQFIICSHSAEILAGAFGRPHCSLFHLRSRRSLAKVRLHDQGEVRDALRRLGSSESEALLYRGTILVEGIHDKEVLQVGFPDLLRRYMLKDRGGRGPVEKDIKELQKAESENAEIGNHYFIFDGDRKPSGLVSTNKIKILQLPRYCLENYLLDVEIITDLSREHDIAERPFSNTTDLKNLMKELSQSQLKEIVARETFREFGLEQVGFDMKSMEESAFADMAQKLWSGVESMKNLFGGWHNGGFEEKFVQMCQLKMTNERERWDEKWAELCDGKKLFNDLRRGGHIRGDLLRLKRRIVLEMKLRGTEIYGALARMLEGLLA